MYDGVLAESIMFIGSDMDEVEAYFARPLGPGPYPGVIVLHHSPGYDAVSKEITRTFAVHGYLAICPNLYWREAPHADPDDAASISQAAGGVPDGRLVGDVKGAASFLRRLQYSNEKVGVIGYCSGGRQAFLAACSLDLDAAVDCYGAWLTKGSPEGYPIVVPPIVDMTPQLSCPLLGLFGQKDIYPTPEEVDELEAALKRSGKTYEFHRYTDAGHAFFSVNRPFYRVEAALDGWQRVWKHFEKYLASRV